jgi:dihydroorotase
MRLLDLTGIRLAELITRMSTSPANILGIEAGTLSVGATADICIFSDDDDWQLSQDNMISQGKNTPFYGWNFSHRVRHTLVRGKNSYRFK